MKSMLLAHPDLVPAVRTAAELIAVPRREQETSFTLHAPLELLARVGLLPYLDDETRAGALARISRLADTYAATGTPVATPAAVEFPDPMAAAVELAAALRAGAGDRVDAIACWLAPRVDHTLARHLLAPAIVDSLAAAGHAPIGLHLLPRVAGGGLSLALLRGALRSIARQPAWRIDWFAQAITTSAPVTLRDALAAVPRLGPPGSSFIYPLMSQVQQSGVATRVLGPALAPDLDVAAATRTLLRAAAWSMLHEDPRRAPYGWTHCLSMPQAVLTLADDGVPARTAVAVAATHVAGFRAAYATQALPSLADDASEVDPSPPNERALASFAALHANEHLVKYTLACLHACATDPAWRSTYLRAAAYLADWWRAHPDGEV